MGKGKESNYLRTVCILGTEHTVKWFCLLGIKEAVSQSCSGKGITVTGSDHILLQHLALVTVICEASVPSPGWVQGTPQEFDALSSCLYRRSFMKHLVV